MAVKLRKKRDFISYKEGETKVKFKFDKSFLNMVILLIFSKSRSVSRSNLQVVRKLFDFSDSSIYTTNVEMYSRILFIKKALECRLTKGIEKREVVLEECRMENDEENEKIIEMIRHEKELSVTEIRALNQQISDRVQFAFIYYFMIIILS